MHTNTGGSPERTHSGTKSLTVRVARSMFWLVWSRGAVQILSFITTVVIARILSPSDYGVMAIAGIWTTSIGMLAEMGLGTALVQFRKLERSEIDTCFWLTTGLGLLGCVFLIVMSPLIANWFRVARLADVLPILSLVLPITAIRVVSDSLLQKELRLDRISQAEMIARSLTLPVMVACAFSHFGIWTLVIAAVIYPTIRTGVTLFFRPWCPKLKLGGSGIRELVGFSLSSFGAKILWVLRETSDAFLLGKVSGDVAVGVYDMAKQVALLPTSRISSVVNLMSGPLMAELQTNVDLMRVTFYRTLRLTAAIAVPASVGVALLGDLLVTLLLGPKWVAAIPILRLLYVYSAVRAVDVLLPPVLFARRRERFLLKYNLISLFAIPAACLSGALWGGAVGMVLLFTPTYCTVMMFMAKEALRELGGSFRELGLQIWPVMAATGFMALALACAREAGLGEGPASFVSLGLLVATGGVSYIVALRVIGGAVFQDAMQVAIWLVRGRHAVG